MKMVKSLLLASAAGLVAIAGAQAADLPVKAKAVEYVKVCSLYGAGFYYIPGTDICLKVGGHVRADIGYGGGSSLTTGPFASGWNNRAADNPWVQRNLFFASFDARSQTAYGTARAYFAVGQLADSPNGIFNSAYNYRGFIQWAGFTFGQAQSFFDFYSYAGYQYYYGIANDTIPSGARLAAYTAQFGGGVSATLSLEEPRRTTITNSTTAGSGSSAAIPTLLAGNYVAIRWPDVVANLRVDQAWGSAQVMGAVHDASVSYLGALVAGGAANGELGQATADAIGWAVGAGVKVNLPSLGAGDSIALQGVYAVGATKYAANLLGYNAFSFNPNNGTMGFGLSTDGVQSATGINLTTSWSLAAALEHFWRPDLKTSVWVNYVALDYGAAANAQLAGINNDWSTWAVGTRTQWDVSKQLSLGGEVVYSYLKSACAGVCVYNVTTAGNGIPVSVWNMADQSEWSFRFRAQYNFLP